MFASTISKLARPNLGNRQWMPTMPMVLLSAENATPSTPATAQFRVLPKMTKHEVKEYLTKIYGLPVTEVRTQNYMGKRMRIFGKRQVVYAKRPDYKKAFVTFDGKLADTGLGGAIYGEKGNNESEPKQGQIEA